MSSEYSSCPQSTVYVHRVRYISSEYSLFPYIIVYAPNITVYVPIVQFISSENSLCPYTIVYIQRVEFMFQ